MNAGGSRGTTPMALTTDGATTIFAANGLRHAVLLDALLTTDRLTGVAVYAGSEAARGIPKLRTKRPTFESTSVKELHTVIDGTYFAGREIRNHPGYGQASTLARCGWRRWPASTPSAGSSP